MKQIREYMVMLVVLLFLPVGMQGQTDSTTFVPSVKVGKVLFEEDSIGYLEIPNIYVYPEKTFKSTRQQKKYTRLVYNVKKVLPIAKEVHGIILETYETLQTIPTKKERQAHLKLVEQSIKEQYTPRMKKLSLSQGKLLIKLVHRETRSSGYQLVQAFLGPIRAGFYQAFAWTFGASLNKKYDPEGEDKEIELIVLQVESGQI